MNSWFIKNAQVVTPEGTLYDASVWIEDGRIRQIGHIPEYAAQSGQVLDAAGAIVMPGIIDMHTDAMDAEIVPRPGADIPIPVAFRELERKMCGCGITTVYHSLHLGYINAQSHSRSKYSRGEVFREVSRAAAGPTLIHNKIHLRFELTGIAAFGECLDLIREGYVDLLSVMDHTPGQGQDKAGMFKTELKAKGKSEAETHQMLQEWMTRPKLEGDSLQAMVDLAKKKGIPVASHDDDSIEKVDEMVALGVTISEFPINMETAKYATRMGMYVAGGASNVLRGGSLSGNLDMTAAIREGAVGMLCSDYYPASILHSVFRLHGIEGMALHEAVNLATLHPAQSVGIDDETGSLEAGKQADLLVVRLQDSIPMITHVMVGGKMVLQTATKSTGRL
jgi:alpha-D-ribose 1-methylphosphonate 5-triphosphate diphosphatase